MIRRALTLRLEASFKIPRKVKVPVFVDRLMAKASGYGKRLAGSWMKGAIKAAFDVLVEAGFPVRPVTGPVRFGEDLPGVYLAGDMARYMAGALGQFLRDGRPASQRDLEQLQGLVRLLASTSGDTIEGPNGTMVLCEYREALRGRIEERRNGKISKEFVRLAP